MIRKTTRRVAAQTGHIFRALSYRNYRLFFAGQGISVIGTWMQQLAMSWLVYSVTGSPFILGLISFLNQIPSFFITPFAGVLGDRIDKKKVLLATQSLSMIQALILAAMVLTEHAPVWAIALLSLLLGIINSVDAPVRQAFVVHLVDSKKDLGNAIALNSALFNMARLVGPSVAGFVIAAAGEGVCFLANGASYIAVICALLAIQAPHVRQAKSEKDMIAHLHEGFLYAWKSIPIRYLLFLMSLISLLGFSYMVLMPVFAKDILHGGAHTLGLLMGAGGTGALAGALYLASRKTVRGLLRITGITSVITSILQFAFAFSTSQYLSMGLTALIGFCLIMMMGSVNTIIQTIVDDDKRGRVMSIYTMAFMGTTPIGSLIIGEVSSVISAPQALAVSSVCCLAGSIFFMFRLPEIRKAIRPVYEKLGILPKSDLSTS